MKVPVLIPRIFDYPHTYLSGKFDKLKPGSIVLVPFGRKKEIGVIWDKQEKTNKIFKLKNVLEKKSISLNENLIKFINWFSLYNLVPKGMVLKMCLGDESFFSKNSNFIDDTKIKKKNKFNLNPEQKRCLDDINGFGNKFNVTLLQGVTGSGKTIVYFEKIKQNLVQGKQSLVLLPEIFLTNQFEQRFEDYFGFKPSIWHSKITKKNKKIIWQNIVNNKIKLVVGARSSLFLPFKKLGLIVVDEEHDSSYKQDEGLRYNARDMAISRASIEDIPIILATSIPSLETYNNVKNKKYNSTKLKKRYKNFLLPSAEIVNLNLNKKNKNIWLDIKTLNLARKYLDSKQQVLFFLNRRGYAPFLICKKCGLKLVCPNCSVFLTFHKQLNKAMCHHCGHKSSIKQKCQKTDFNCEFQMYGPGVEKIFAELRQIFPDKVIKILSSDFLNKKKETINLLKDIENNKVNILVGTQLISKGFNFPNLNCIVVVDADFSGMGFDLRSTEKNIQLYNQLSGRAGRFSKKSLIIYQTFNPSDKTLSDILENNPEKFLEEESCLRKEKKLPPFSRLIAFIVESNNEKESFLEAQKIKKNLLLLKDIEVMGPVTSPIFKIKNKYRTRLLLRSQSNVLVQKKISRILKNLNISKKIKLTVDVDPLNFS
ncbi:MAG: primosomal protein N' [Pelagibacteraceae bacterium]|nr:primosomal protein N' [Pelagibacteraceae bacterium]MBO6481339.1 primosomal protein N' [Pelagibacteraceae bacterium]MBO6484357.1 primosomal protein N' [Pelagibacteraceae bacterium]MBO6486869.1 primosomal protein N' [Pelagibacteraceae bacterium]MBO6487377.1 primosomal protein N' [Pelagibacteraceae bacterium]